MSRRKPRIPWGSIVFTLVYVAFVAAGCWGIRYGLGLLEEKLVAYEANLPAGKSWEVFRERFQTPDWQAICAELGIEDTAYESAADFESYMNARVAGRELRFYEVTGDSALGHKYVVAAGEDVLASFALRDMDPAQDQADWQYVSCEVFYAREESAWICTEQDVTVLVNGVALEEDAVCKTLHTQVEEQLEEGEHGLRLQWLYVEGLLNVPRITALDAAGTELELTLDPETGVYTQVLPPMEISEEERAAVVEAAKVYCRYGIRDTDTSVLRQHFDRNSENYKTITGSKSWAWNYKSYNFTEAELEHFRRYSDTHFSVRLKMGLDIKYQDGTTQELLLEQTFFLKKQEDGSWLVTDMTDRQVQTPITLVRLRYVVEGETVGTAMAPVEGGSVVPPAVEVPQGQVLLGWHAQELGVTLLPQEDGSLLLPEVQEPVTLYALLEKEN